MAVVTEVRLLLMVWEATAAAAAAFSFMPRSPQLDAPQATFVAAVEWARRHDLAGCSFTVVGTADRDADGLLVASLAGSLAAARHPYQVWAVRAWRQRAVARSIGDAYIILAQDVLALTEWLQGGVGTGGWDWRGHYLVYTLASARQLHRLASSTFLIAPDIHFFLGVTSGGGDKGGVALYVHRRFPHPKLHYLMHWPSIHHHRPRLFSAKSWQPPDGMGGRAVRVLAVNHAPSVFSTADATGRLRSLSGLDIRVVRALGEALNFTPEFFDPGPDLWGSLLPNGTFSGMVGQVSKGLAEVGVGNVFLTEARAQHVTFTVPYDFEQACFLTPAPSPLPSWMAMTFPFTLPVWMLVLGGVAVMTVLVAALGAAQVRRDWHLRGSLNTAFLFVVATLCNQSRPLPSRPSMQVMAAGLVVCGFVVSVFFASNLTAFLTVATLRPPITSIRQIIQSRLEVGGYSDFWVPLFRGSANPVVQHLGDNFYRFDNVTEFLKQVIRARGVLVENTQHLKYLQETFLTDRLGRSPVRLMLEECINPFGVGAMLTRNSPLKSSFDAVIQRLREGGFVDRFFQEEVRVHRGKATSSLSLTVEGRQEDGVRPLTLNHLQGAFLVLGVGLGGALLLLLLRVTAAAVHTRITPAKMTHVGRR